MKISRIIYKFLLLSFLIGGSCIEPYQPPIVSNTQNILVVDGSLNTNGISEVILTRVLSLASSDDPAVVTGATVKAENTNGLIIPFTENSPGHYFTTSQNLPTSVNYRLVISTADNKKYASSFVQPIVSPKIDSVTWELTNDKGVQIYANSSDLQNNTKRYLWKYTETWLYTSAFESKFVWVAGSIVGRPSNEDIFRCYQTAYSTKILFSTTEALSQDIITRFPVTYIPQNSERISKKYSILITQYGLTQEGYNYWVQLKKNTENLGTLFDVQPNLVTGNFSCLTTPDDVVLGFFNAGTTSEKRIFIAADRLAQLDIKKYNTIYSKCTADTLFNNEIASWKNSANYTVIDIASKGRTTVGYRISDNACVDCRRKNGTNIKPSFWE